MIQPDAKLRVHFKIFTFCHLAPSLTKIFRSSFFYLDLTVLICRGNRGAWGVPLAFRPVAVAVVVVDERAQVWGWAPSSPLSAARSGTSKTKSLRKSNRGSEWIHNFLEAKREITQVSHGLHFRVLVGYLTSVPGSWYVLHAPSWWHPFALRAFPQRAPKLWR